jgi:hypothetical protein
LGYAAAVGGAIGLGDYLEAGSITFLFTLADWLEARSSDKVTTFEVSKLLLLHGILACMKFTLANGEEFVQLLKKQLTLS